MSHASAKTLGPPAELVQIAMVLLAIVVMMLLLLLLSRRRGLGRSVVVCTVMSTTAVRVRRVGRMVRGRGPGRLALVLVLALPMPAKPDMPTRSA